MVILTKLQEAISEVLAVLCVGRILMWFHDASRKKILSRLQEKCMAIGMIMTACNTRTVQLRFLLDVGNMVISCRKQILICLAAGVRNADIL